MKKEIHPKIFDTVIKCACGATLETKSTEKEIHVEICSNCHPFFSGEAQRLIDIEGQVDRFYKKLTARQTFVEQKKAKEESKTSPDREIGELGLTTRATEALKKGGILTVGQLLTKLTGEGDRSVLAIAGFGQSSLTTAKKKLRVLGYELPETAVT